MGVHRIRSTKALLILLILLLAELQMVRTIYGQGLHYVTMPDGSIAQINNFQEGLAKVETITGAIGYIDTLGHFKIIPSKNYATAGDFQNGYAWVGKYFSDTLKYGFIDRTGKLVVGCHYKELEDYFDDRAVVYNDEGGWQVIDGSGNVVFGDSLLITEMAAYNTDIVNGWVDIEPPAFHQGLMRIRKDGKYGFIDTAGRIILPCQYLEAGDFVDSVALVAFDTMATRLVDSGKKAGFLDSLYNSLPVGPPSYK